MRQFGMFTYQKGKDANGTMNYMVTVEEKIKEGNKIIARLFGDESDLVEVQKDANLFVQSLGYREAERVNIQKKS